MSVSIRKSVPGDEAALALVGAATFLETYAGVVDGAAIVRHCAQRQTEAVYAAALADPEQALWLAEAAPGAAPSAISTSPCPACRWRRDPVISR